MAVFKKCPKFIIFSTLNGFILLTILNLSIRGYCGCNNFENCNDNTRIINFILLILSTFIINLTKVQEIFGQIREKNKFDNTRYFLYGQLLFSITIFYTCIFDIQPVKLELIGALFVVISTMLFSIISEILPRKVSEASVAIFCKKNDNNETNKDDNGKNGRKLVFLDGTSGVGKTTMSNFSIDFEHYIKITKGMYKDKGEWRWLQEMYNARHYNDIVTLALDVKESQLLSDETILCDRYYISQFVYAVIFEFGGNYVNPEVFQSRVNESIFGRKEILTELSRLMLDWTILLKRLVGETIDIREIFVISSDEKFTVDKVLKRGGVHSKKNFNQENFIKNQNWLFEKLCELRDFEKPKLLKVKLLSNSILKDII